jgi:Ras GTPase-activating-like protein IQGAP2/3
VSSVSSFFDFNLRSFQTASNDDTLKVILAELGGVPHLDNEELKDARDSAITLELTNRFADVRGMLTCEHGKITKF